MATATPPLRKTGLVSRILRRSPDGKGDVLAGPIRGELFGAERLAEHARAVARRQRLLVREERVGRGPLLARLDESRQILDEARDELGAAADRGTDVSPAGEWLLDNFYVVQEHIREIRTNMPRGYYRELPKLSNGPLAGYPRVYELAIELIAHTEGHLELDNIHPFTREFQRVTALNMGELWAIPTMLRLGLVENIRRIALRVMQRTREVELADAWSGRLRAASEKSGPALAAELATFVNDHPPLTPVFIARFVQQIRNYQTDFTPLLWLEQWMAEEGLSPDEAVARSNQRLALTQVTVANSITSLRAIARLDWKTFFESQSATEAVLRDDPPRVYTQMTFATRDLYRHVVEHLAKRTKRPEQEVARAAVTLAQGAVLENPDDPRMTHVGYFLTDAGRLQLEREVGYRARISERLYRAALRYSTLVYFGAIAVLTAAALWAVFGLVEPSSIGVAIVVLLVALIPVNESAISAVNQLVTFFMPPHLLSKLETREHGIPEELRTAVVVPTIFANLDSVKEAVEHLEIQYLANRDPHLHFALLSDFTDSETGTQDGDAAILEAAAQGISELNSKYAGGAPIVFYLFHRPRLWNEKQGVWMGWERKRGKLAQFNKLVRGGPRDAFTTIVGDLDLLERVRYVITLDSDTVLPHNAAQLMVGAMAHPLNRPAYDPVKGRVVRGYAILQPRVGISLTSAHRSHFAAIHSGHPGVDPYTTAVSDVYQDLFGEGSFTGKGIYDVDAFEQATLGRFPENTLLSHDLIEGTYSRAALLTDVEVFDDYPTRYLTYTRRKHRWIRGDWQLLRWLGKWVPSAEGRSLNRLSWISRWKIFDNLRRSVSEIALVALFVAGWIALPGSPLLWTAIGLGAMAFPWIFSLLLAAIRPPRDKSWMAYYAAIWRDALTSAQQFVLALTFLLHQAVVSADAIIRTLGRLFITKRNLLEWQTASQVERVAASSRREVWYRMMPAVIMAAAISMAVLAHVFTTSLAAGESNTVLGRPAFLAPIVAALPILTLWIISPASAHALSAPTLRRELRLTSAERTTAMRYALAHWRYFDFLVTEDTQWLAPDNFQEDPVPVIAGRTSPTNVGLQLMATVAARDLGFTTTAETVDRLELVLRALERLRRFRGHFYNWYNLRDLRVLEPAYISSVDSGNLAASLLAVKQACLSLPDEPVLGVAAWEALQGALSLASEMLRELLAIGAVAAPQRWKLLSAVARQVRLLRAMSSRPVPQAELRDALQAMHEPMQAASKSLGEAGFPPESAGPDPARETRYWLDWGVSLIERHLAATEALGVPQPSASATLRELAATSPIASEQVGRLDVIANRLHDYAMEMDFRFLFDERRKLFAIGYDVAHGQLDNSYYDLLASEARLGSFIAIAKGDVPVEHWFRLGRSLTATAGATALVSWSGSMFEYLMPLLVMRSFPFTLLDQTYQGAVKRQIAYGNERGVPWGISESAYNVRDRTQTYQYRGFGVPDLALKRGLAKDLVIAPYATLLALHVEPHAAMKNALLLERENALGPFGFRDALDYTRPDPGSSCSVVGTYMAHHLGMGIVALDNALQSQIWQRRFHSESLVRAAELLLFERIPRRLVLQEAQSTDRDDPRPVWEPEKPAVREIDTADTPQPRVALLGNLPYSIMISNAGSGYSRSGPLAVTRWRADSTRDPHGQFCYVRDLTANRFWSVAHQPLGAPADSYEVTFATDRVTFHRRDGTLETTTEIAVVPEDLAEVRRVTITNRSSEDHELELTSYGEIVLGPIEADRTHPVFGNLFVETEWMAVNNAVLATRRPRSSTEQRFWCAHVAAVERDARSGITCETDRARFIGRDRSPRNPVALEHDGPLDGTVGAVLDPIFALRVRVTVPPGRSARVAFTTLVTSDRDRAIELIDRYDDPYAAQRALDLSWTRTQVELRDIGVTPADAALFQQLAGHLFYSNPVLRAPQRELQENERGQQTLWSLGLSGDWPILLAMIDTEEGMPTVRQLLVAHHYLRLKGMTIDLVILNTRPPSYIQELSDQITTTVMASTESGLLDKPGGVFIRRSDILAPEELLALRATARVHVRCDGSRLSTTLDLPDVLPQEPPQFEPSMLAPRDDLVPSSATPTARKATPHLQFHNGLGGMTPDGEYEIRLRDNDVTPAPWANIIANPEGGFCVTETGGGFTWAASSYFYRLTPWYNDPIGDPPGDVIYLRDDETGSIWSATPQPLRHRSEYIVRHGAGYSEFSHEHMKIGTVLTLGIAPDSAVKIVRLRVTNRGSRPRRITVTSFVEWCLGSQREHTQHQVRTRFLPELNSILAQNFFEPQFARMVAFSSMSEPLTSYTADRREFLGRHGDVSDPAALSHTLLAERAGAATDPCAALQCKLQLAAGETREIVVLLGAAEGEAAARALIERYRILKEATRAVEATRRQWDACLSTIVVHTPEPSFDVVLNRWTLYQALSCRMWGRSAIYQSSGAYGFRDQLQDVMAFVYAETRVARDHIIRAAGRQFVEGDVQHWWHPQSGRGVRTRFSDDLAWLPYVVDHYVVTTGDTSVLDEKAPFLEMRSLGPEEHEIYDLPRTSAETGTVYEHCVRALRKACTVGAHGLPLIGIGDWNDGMNRVGVEGRGESVWLAWFLITTLRKFASHATARDDQATAEEFRRQADAYRSAVEESSWDGEWYRRAYFDDGTPLGSSQNDECRIDAIAQSWSVISGAGDPERSRVARQSLEKHLVDERNRLIMLLAPPFDRMAHDPGYIKGYLPGVRENGAQYTHAALWVVLATAMQGDGDRAFELFQILNPLTHARTPEEVETYKVEPYVVAADVYMAEGHRGRGGWTWYTGSASWMYRVGLEAILGFSKRGDGLVIDPRIPRGWDGFKIDYRFGKSVYEITVKNPRHVSRGVVAVTLDGAAVRDRTIPLVDDGARKAVVVEMGESGE